MRNILMVVFAALAFGAASPAWAVYPFECGVYRIDGKLHLEGKEGPTLVVFDRTQSRTVIPVKLSPDMTKRFKKTKASPFPGSFTVEIRDRGYRPEDAVLLDERWLDRIDHLASESAVKLKKKLSCPRAAGR